MKRIQKRKLELQPLTIRKLERVRGGVGGDEEIGIAAGLDTTRTQATVMTCVDPTLLG